MKPVNASTPCLSVVMPVYNEKPTLAGAISAVFAQPVVGELICIDDGSTDGSAELVREMAKSESRIRPIVEREPPCDPA